MSKIHIVELEVTGAVQKFSAPYKFEVHFECIEPVKEALEFKVIYIGKADDELFDLELDRVEIDDIPVGLFKFSLICDAPETSKIPPDDLLGVTVILLCGSYKGREFVRVGYYVHVTYDDPALLDDPPLFPVYEKLTRQLMIDSPRVTHYTIPWDQDSVADLVVEGSEAEPIRKYMQDANEYMRQMETRLQQTQDDEDDQVTVNADKVGNEHNASNEDSDSNEGNDKIMLF